jgi:hypothetical protein
MTFSNSNKARSHVFIDESIDGSENNFNRYVISSVVIHSEIRAAKAAFDAAGFKNGFKSSKYGRPIRQGRLRTMTRWLETQDFECFAVAIKPIDRSAELTRQILLKEVFSFWSGRGYDRFFMDSRDHLDSRNWKMNDRDTSSLMDLISEGSVPRNSHISFHKDEEDFRFAIADFTAFIVRRHIGLEETQFLELIQKKIKIKDFSEKKRGR